MEEKKKDHMLNVFKCTSAFRLWGMQLFLALSLPVHCDISYLQKRAGVHFALSENRL